MLNRSSTKKIRKNERLIKLSLKKNRRHRLAEKYVCQHFDPLIQLRFIYSRAVRELHLPRIRAGSLSTTCGNSKGKRKGGKGKGEDRVFRNTRKSNASRTAFNAVARRNIPLAIPNVCENAPKVRRAVYLIVPQFRTTRIQHTTRGIRAKWLPPRKPPPRMRHKNASIGTEGSRNPMRRRIQPLAFPGEWNVT